MTMLGTNWWTFAVRGVVTVVFGLLAFFWPMGTIEALVLLFGAVVLLDGLFAIAAAVGAARWGLPWWPPALEGVLGIGAGIASFVWPGMTALVLLYIIAFWAIATGVFEIVAAIHLRKELTGEWMLALSGAASVLFGLLLVFFPGEGALAVIWIIGAYAVIFGVLLLALAFRLRSWQQTARGGAASPTRLAPA